MVPLLLLSRSTWPPSCRAKESTNRPPNPESSRRGSTPLPSSETIRRSSPAKRFSVTATVPFGSPGKASAVVDSLKVLDPKRPIREADIGWHGRGNAKKSLEPDQHV